MATATAEGVGSFGNSKSKRGLARSRLDATLFARILLDLDLSVCTSIHATLSRQSQRRFIGNRACGSSSRRLRRAFLPHHEIHQEENNKEGVSVVVVVGNGAVIVICTRAPPRGPSLRLSDRRPRPSALPPP